MVADDRGHGADRSGGWRRRIAFTKLLRVVQHAAFVAPGARRVVALAAGGGMVAAARWWHFLHTGQARIVPILAAVALASITAWVLHPGTLPHLFSKTYRPALLRTSP